jgi:CheY-like chemotaxis protein
LVTNTTGIARVRVLVVDDNMDVADSLAVVLELSGFDVRVCYDGFAAFAAVKVAMPDCVITDFDMHLMDGGELVRRLRGLPGGLGATVVCLTGHFGEHQLRKLEQAGFDHILFKPETPANVLRILRAVPRSS